MAVIHAITPHHRGPEMLAACLESLDASTGVDLRVVVVANGRDAELPAITEELERVSVVESDEPLGFSEANNLGVDWARRELGQPDFHFFVNNDVVVEPDTLERLVRATEETGAKVAGPLLLIEWARDHINSLGLNVTEDAWGWDEGIGVSLEEYGPLPKRREVLAVTGSALLIDANLLGEVGGWTEIYEYYLEDIDLCLKARRQGELVILEPEAVAYHHISASVGLGSTRKNLLFWRNRLLLALIHWPQPLLVDLVRRAIFEELLPTMPGEEQLSRTAMAEALAYVPTALEIRQSLSGGDESWTRFLRPAGSLPLITLPESPDQPLEGRPAPSEASSRPKSTLVTAATRAVRPAGLGIAAWRKAEELRRRGSAGSGRRILVLGCSPLPFENERMNYAPGGRTWQFASGLAADGHCVCVACARIPGAYGRTLPRLFELDCSHRNELVIFTLEDRLFFETDALEGLIETFEPEVLVGASPRPARRAVELAGRCPVWVDVFGDVMAEGQARDAKAAEANLDTADVLPAYRDLLVPLLLRGDAFSVVSTRQMYSLIGQLGFAGRLNRETAGEDLVSVIPCCAFRAEQRNDEARGDSGELWPGDFVALWGGGFNTWCDVETLVEGMSDAMEKAADLRLVVTGGAIAGHDESSYRSFLELVAESRHSERFVVMGRLDAEEARRIRARADIGVVTERHLYERELGSSGRIAAWLGEGLPVVCTALSELGETVENEGLGFVYQPGSARDLSRTILEAREDRRRLEEVAARARRFAALALDPAKTTAPLRAWVKKATPSSDRSRRNSLDVWHELQELREESARERERWAVDRERWVVERAEHENRFHAVRGELGDIHHSRMWKVWMVYQAALRLFTAPRRWWERS